MGSSSRLIKVFKCMKIFKELPFLNYLKVSSPCLLSTGRSSVKIKLPLIAKLPTELQDSNGKQIIQLL